MGKVESIRWIFAVLMMTAFYLINQQSAAMLALFLIAVFGLPHGAADALRMWGRWSDWRRFCAATIFYAVVAVVAVGLFYQFPLAGLLVFIAISIWHFGRQDATDFPAWSALGVGGLFIFAPFLLWSNQLHDLFGWLRLPPQSIQALIDWCVYAFYVSVACCLLLAILRSALRGRVLRLLLLSVPVAVLLPPLLSFSLYFAVLHAPQHARVLHVEWPNWWRHPLMLGTLFVSWLLIALWLVYGSAVSIDQGIAEVLIIGMAAVTVPHMMLDFYLSNQSRVVTPQS
jgi:beta-carotene 15,15'-dioxygenase